MKIKLMSGYDVAKNYLEILKSYEKLKQNNAQSVLGIVNTNIPAYRKVEKVYDTFVKETEKVTK